MYKRLIKFIKNIISDKINNIDFKKKSFNRNGDSPVNDQFNRLLYYTLVYPYVHYGNIIWGNTYPPRLETIKKLQEKIIRIITFLDYRARTSPPFQKLTILPLDEKRNDEATALFTFNYFNRMLPVTIFFLIQDPHQKKKKTRNYARTNYKKYSIKHKGRQIWNNLPAEIINSSSPYVFNKNKNIKKNLHT